MCELRLHTQCPQCNLYTDWRGLEVAEVSGLRLHLLLRRLRCLLLLVARKETHLPLRQNRVCAEKKPNRRLANGQKGAAEQNAAERQGLPVARDRTDHLVRETACQ